MEDYPWTLAEFDPQEQACPAVSVPAPLAGRIPLPALRCRQGLALGFRFVAVCRLRPPGSSHGENDRLGHA